MTINNCFDYASKYYNKETLNYLSKSEKIRLTKIQFFVGTENKVLDLGCYDGSLGKLLIENKNDVYGIDASEEALHIAKKNGLKVKSGDLEKIIDFDDGYFDVVVAGEIIEHIVNTDFFIDEIKRVLKPNGVLILSTPNVASLGRRLLLLFGKNPYFEASLGFPPNATAGHIRFFTKDLLCDFLVHKGLNVVEFTSDCVNLIPSGKINSKFLADLMPSFGRSLIIKTNVNLEG